ncbi:hypothetical protein HZ992_14755 [Rhizobacter sp. AJA081-3]|uniref:hypothetical protein n=1 Tax=Rhizobacter sp. AJA081-3 TaxID=2753607 RepID=UPI001AE06177|nr:hypothetical protein [Rhizobacter sp. AJA081-3]QTN21444.1 hypothetical protein HZ992_14755 [Rhizobacter sp. AJA081-3]
MPDSPTIRELVEYGLTNAAEGRTVQVPLQDLLFVNQVLGELVRFFHQPEHFPNLAALRGFLGSQGDGGAYEVMAEAYYTRLRGMLPPDIESLVASGALDHPSPPAYYRNDA